jgi:Fe-S oxidoreductase
MACVEACPVAIEHVPKIVDMRRNLVLEETRFPSELTKVFNSLERNNNPFGLRARTRADWAKGLGLKILSEHPDEPVDVPLTLVVYPGADGAGSYYEDDGHSFAYRQGEWLRIALQWNDAARRLSLRLAPGSATLSEPRRFDVRVVGGGETRRVTFTGEATAVALPRDSEPQHRR